MQTGRFDLDRGTRNLGERGLGRMRDIDDRAGRQDRRELRDSMVVVRSDLGRSTGRELDDPTLLVDTDRLGRHWGQAGSSGSGRANLAGPNRPGKLNSDMPVIGRFGTYRP